MLCFFSYQRCNLAHFDNAVTITNVSSSDYTTTFVTTLMIVLAKPYISYKHISESVELGRKRKREHSGSFFPFLFGSSVFVQEKLACFTYLLSLACFLLLYCLCFTCTLSLVYLTCSFYLACFWFFQFGLINSTQHAYFLSLWVFCLLCLLQLTWVLTQVLLICLLVPTCLLQGR